MALYIFYQFPTKRTVFNIPTGVFIFYVILQIVLVRRLELAVRTLELVSRVDELHVLLEAVHGLAALGTNLAESVVVFFIRNVMNCPFMIPQINGRSEFV